MTLPQLHQPVRFIRPYQDSHQFIEPGKRGEVHAATTEEIVVKLYESPLKTPGQVISVVFHEDARESSSLDRFSSTCEFLNRRGVPWERYPGTGVFLLSLGPHSPIPGERLQVVIYDESDRIVRRLEEERGEPVHSGYGDAFSHARFQHATYKYR